MQIQTLTFHQILGITAAILAIVQIIPYVVSILRGKTKPSRSTYVIWTVINVVIALSYISAGATTTVLLRIVAVGTSLLVLALSFKYGMGGLKRLDLVCFAVAGFAIALWLVSKNPVLAVYMSLAASTIGFIPTIRKSVEQPETENMMSWGITTVAALLNVMALTTLRPEIAIVPIFSLAINAILFAILVNGALRRQLNFGRRQMALVLVSAK